MGIPADQPILRRHRHVGWVERSDTHRRGDPALLASLFIRCTNSTVLSVPFQKSITASALRAIQVVATEVKIAFWHRSADQAWRWADRDNSGVRRLHPVSRRQTDFYPSIVPRSPPRAD
jgi:hypothetical protein